MNKKVLKSNSEDISGYLQQFCQTLDDIVTGKKDCRLQLRDINLFKSIKHKIDSYPVLNELYSKIEQGKAKNSRPKSSMSVYSRNSLRPASGFTGTNTAPNPEGGSYRARLSVTANTNGNVVASDSRKALLTRNP